MALDWDVIDESTRVFQCRLDYDDKNILATVTWKIGESELEVKLGSGYGDKSISIGELGILSAFLSRVVDTIEHEEALKREADAKLKAEAEATARANAPVRTRKKRGTV